MDTVIDFGHSGEAERWHSLNDAVMGGVSRGGLHQEGDVCVFTGNVSLEHNGGFASVRRQRTDLGLEKASGVRLHLRGDGHRYQLRLHSDALPDNGAAYRVRFSTNGQWQTLAFPWDAFEPVFRGRPLHDAPAMNAADIRQLGLMTGDKQPGPFRLELAVLEALT